MNHCKMRFKGFEFSVNPTDVTVKCEAMTNSVAVPLSEHIIQELGFYPKRIDGKGVFAADGYAEKYAELENIFKQGGKGDLLISGCEPIKAVMTKLEMHSEGGRRGIEYSFGFIQVPDFKKSDSRKRTYIAGKNENLFNIAAEFDVEIERLLKLNPNISAPFDVKEGDEVIIK